MTVPAGKTPYHSYSPGDAMAAEAIPFDFGSADDLVVQVAGGGALAYGTEYAITGDPATGTASITALIDAGDDVWELWSETPREQQIDLSTTRTIEPAQYERELDRRARIEREIDVLLARAIKVPRGETPPEFPGAAYRTPGYLLGFTALGALVALEGGAGAAAPSLTDLAAPTGASLIGYSAPGVGAVPSSVEEVLNRTVWAEDYGFSPSATAAENTEALLKAIAAARGPTVTYTTDGLGAGSFDTYSGGTIEIGAGHFQILPDTIEIVSDHALTIRGKGSRRTANAQRGRTVLLVVGTSSGFGLRWKGNGARGLTLEDLDLSYRDSGFTGTLFDAYGTPGNTYNRVFFGTYGFTGNVLAPDQDQRKQTAARLYSDTYAEYTEFNNCVFDGAVKGFHPNDTRGTVGDFGGSHTKFDKCVFYDFTDTAIKIDGARTLATLALHNCAVNPIAMNCVRALDISNINSLDMTGCGFGGSTSFYATSGWVRLENCTGIIHCCDFQDNAVAGTLNGVLDVRGNHVFCENGFTVTGGIITGAANEFSRADNASGAGWVFSPTTTLNFNIGPDLFKSECTRSYDIPADSAFLSGMINYGADYDASINKFRNTSSRVTVLNVDRKPMTTAATTVNVTLAQTGRTYYGTSATTQTVNIPAASAENSNAEFTFVKVAGAGDMVITAPAAIILNGTGTARTTITLAAAKLGARVKIKGTSTNWLVEYEQGDLVYA